jgi:cobalt/nickel transport system permease protein
MTTLPLQAPSLAASPLGRLDPRWKQAAFLLAAFAFTALESLGPCVVALAGALALVLLARLPLRWYLARLAPVTLLLIPFAGVLPFVATGDGPTWSIGPIGLSEPGVIAAARLCLKAIGIVTLMVVLFVAATPADSFHAAQALHVPALLVQLIVLTYRYLFLLIEELGRLRIALRVRGYRHRSRLPSYRLTGQVAGILLVRSHERAERVGQAMRCRGFAGRFHSLRVFHTAPADVLFFCVMTGSAAGLLLWDLLER